MDYSWHDVVGNLGVGFIVVTYLLLQLGRLSSRQLSYSLLNALGAALVIVSLIFEFNFSAFLMEFFWLVISLIGLVVYFRRRNRH